MRKVLEIGGIVAAVVLIAFGIAAIVLAFEGRDTIGSELKTQQITGTPDMASDSPAIAAEVKAITASQQALEKKFKANGVTFTPSAVEVPDCSVAGKQVTTGDDARCFAKYMFIHAMAASSGLVYSQMGRYVAKPGAPFKVTDGNGGTNDPNNAVTDPKTKQPVSNGARNVWIDQVALSTALNSSYMAEQLSLVGIVVGIALLLAGIGFGILAVGGALRSPGGGLVKLDRGGGSP